MRVVLDTNVLVSALLFGGNPAQIIELANTGRIELFISPFILDEFEKVLTFKFKFSPLMAQQAGVLIKVVAPTVEPKKTIQVIRRKTSDNRILECALEAKAEVLVTGDTKDLLPLGRFEGIEILSPAKFLQKYFKDSSPRPDE